MLTIKRKRRNHKISATIFFICALFVVDLFGFNPDRLEGSVVTRNLILPYFRVNITIALAVISTVAISWLAFTCRLSISKIELLLLLRIFLYVFPLAYVSGDFKVGIAYAMIQCFFSYYIGRRYKGDLDAVIILLLIFSIAISVEVFAVIVFNHISIFSSDLKWYMVIPMGKSNYIASILVPTYALVNNYIKKYNKPLFQLVYTLFIAIAVLATGSKLGLIMFLLCIFIEILQGLAGSRKISRRTILRRSVFFVALIIVALFTINKFQNELFQIVLKFITNDIFENRLKVYKETLSLISEHMLFGRSAFSYSVFDATKAHNWILESLVQTGVVGTIIYLYIIIISIEKNRELGDVFVRKMWTIFLFVYLTQGLGEPNLFGTVSDAFFWVLVGISHSPSVRMYGERNNG